MKKKIFLKMNVLFLTVVVLTLAFSVSAMAYSKSKPMILKCGIDNPAMDMKAVTIKRMGDQIEQRTDGRIKFKYFYGGSLIKKPQYVDAVARGIADISTGPISFVTGKIPELSIFEIYGSYQNDQFLEMQEEVEPLLTELFEKKKVHHLFLQYTGMAVFPHKKKFLKTPDDWKGQKMRLAGRWQATLGQKWNASSVFLPPGDLYLAMQRGVIDGYMLIYDIVYGLKLFEVSPYILDSDFTGNVENVTMNLRKWNKLTSQDQQIFNDVIRELKPWTYHQTVKYYERLKKNIISKGGKIYVLSAAEKARFLKDAYELWPIVRKVSKPLGNKIIDILEKYRDR